MQRLRATFDIADLALLIVVAVWAGNNVLVKAAIEASLEPLFYVPARLSIVTLLLAVWLGARGRLRVFERVDLGRFLLLGSVGYAAANILFVVGLDRTTAFASAVMAATAPIFIVLIVATRGMEEVAAEQWLGVLVAFVGAVLFVAGDLRQGSPAAGDLINLLAAFAVAVYSVEMRPVVGKYGAPFVTFWSVAIGLVMVVPVVIAFPPHQDWAALGHLEWGAILYASAVSMFVGYTLWAWSIGHAGNARAAPFMFLIPVLAGLLAWLFLDEAFGAWQIAGAACVLGGVFLALRGRGRL